MNKKLLDSVDDFIEKLNAEINRSILLVERGDFYDVVAFNCEYVEQASRLRDILLTIKRVN